MSAPVSAMRRLVLISVGLELLAGAVALALGGVRAGAAALIGASVAMGAQIFAVSLLRPAMQAKAAMFQQRWVLGMAVRFASFIALATIMILARASLPPAWLAAGYLGTLLVLLFAETRFLT
ncbi:MAG: hypothetical protein Q7J79_05610 [Gemmatimonadales bacterium]|nr:hypothetical protein [Gemmatimonadales bacterium]